ncbi:M6 family metalloprotease domain-containing protein [Thalassolituus hydrocarboniclasticus]|uniref:M6 family metalloprotease domain-containing protein n=1 Tax=Thalassolituus hydrocarboniclasticus TaxID=2742796 RepID=A0ABY6A8V0_9GAMM|nr:M6 family metalloprotease domain-containing protein [Thalassolituus hydrocarboniclasticus]UXD87087.1 M6 family metalloprotease domain-containing protein [Thalassolituus hydrocarboniclasticus]
MIRWSFLLLLLCSAVSRAALLPALQWQQIRLSDDRVIEVMPRADQHQLWVETRDGEALLEVNGYWYYAISSDDGLLSAGEPLVSGSPAPESVVHSAFHTFSAPASRLSTSGISAFSTSVAAPQRKPFRYDVSASYYRQPLLVVRVAFADQAFIASDAEVAARFFGSEGSVQNYYRENSYQRFDIQPAREQNGVADDGIVSITLNSNHPDFGNGYGSNSQALVHDVLAQLGTQLDLNEYDRNGDQWLDPNELGVVFLIAGYEQAYAGAASSRPRIWAHKSTLYQGRLGDFYLAEYAMFGERHQTHLATIGVICHELGHLLFDLPDLYDNSGAGMGIGRWGLMGLGGWNRTAGAAGETPAHMLSWSKEQAGFIRPQIAVAGVNRVALRAVSDGDDALSIDLDKYRHGERLMLEHRRQSGYDQGLPGAGVLVSRINDRAGFGTLNVAQQEGRLLVIEEADGRDDLLSNNNLGEASDLFSSVSGQTLYSAVQGQDSSSGAVQLLQLQAGLVAELDVNLSAATVGDNLGLDELPPNAVWGEAGGSAQVLMTLAVNDGVLSFDGADLFALGSGRADLALYRSFVAGEGQDLLWQDSNFILQSGWNRLLLAEPVAAAGMNSVVLEIRVESLSGLAPLVTDEQGGLSGQTWVRQQSTDTYQSAHFDASARLLVSVEAQAEVIPPQIADPGKSMDAQSSSAAGGALIVLLPLLACAGRRRRTA